MWEYFWFFNSWKSLRIKLFDLNFSVWIKLRQTWKWLIVLNRTVHNLSIILIIIIAKLILWADLQNFIVIMIPNLFDAQWRNCILDLILQFGLTTLFPLINLEYVLIELCLLLNLGLIWLVHCVIYL